MKNGRPKKSDKSHDSWKIHFIVALRSNYGHVGDACAAAGIHPDTAYKHRKEDKIFRNEWRRAKANVINDLEKAAIGRALKGVAKPVFHGGKKVGHVQEYSDGLVIPILRAHRRRYRKAEKTEEVPPQAGTLTIKIAENKSEIKLDAVKEDDKKNTESVTGNEAAPPSETR